MLCCVNNFVSLLTRRVYFSFIWRAGTNTLGIIFFFLIFGSVLGTLGPQKDAVINFFKVVYEVLMKMLMGAIWWVFFIYYCTKKMLFLFFCSFTLLVIFLNWFLIFVYSRVKGFLMTLNEVNSRNVGWIYLFCIASSFLDFVRT